MAHESRRETAEVVVDLGADTGAGPDLLAYASLNGHLPLSEEGIVEGGVAEPLVGEPVEAIEGEPVAEVVSEWEVEEPPPHEL